MKDETRIRKFANQMGMDVDILEGLKFVPEKARKKGAVASLCFTYFRSRDKMRFFSLLNFELNSNGDCVGFSIDEVNSFAPRKSK